MASEIFYKPVRDVLCEDNQKRTAYAKSYRYDGSFAADTFFSVPAYVRANGKTVRGFISKSEDGECFEFFAYSYRKNANVIARIRKGVTAV